MLDLREIPLTAITPSPFQVRKAFDPVKLQEFADSLARVSQAHAILVRPVGDHYELVCGERRWRATQLIMGATTIKAEVQELTDLQARRLSLAENVQREDLSPIEWIAAIAEMVDAEMVDAELVEDAEYAALAETAQLRVRTLLMKLDSDRRNGTDHFTNKFVGIVERLFASLPKPVEWMSYYMHDLPLLKLPEPVKAIAIVEKLNRSKVEALGELHRKAPERFEQMVAEGGIRPFKDLTDRRIKANDVRPLSEVSAEELRQVVVRQQLVQHRGKPASVDTPPFPQDTYRCLVIDPPWPMRKSERTTRPRQGDHLDYPVMTLEAIQDLPITRLADPEGCHVFLWTTQHFLPHAFTLFEAWGVRYECALVWRKPSGFTPFSWRYDVEFCLFGRVGHLRLQVMGLPLWFEARTDRHSAKPDIFYERVLEVSPTPRLELFARKPREGFQVWGHEVRMISDESA
jgi:ParB-like chromosome segregation protein Spo0J